MFYGDSVQDTRQMFYSSWQKYKLKQVLLPLEQQIVEVILTHPEYHAMLEAIDSSNQAYFPESGLSNPFLHLGLHLAIREQIQTDRPEGIALIYKKLLTKYTDPLSVEHLMIEHLAECLWQAQRSHQAPDERNYLDALGKLLH